MTNEEAIKLIDDRMCFGRGKWSEHHKPEIDIYWHMRILPKRGKWILDRSGAYCCSECMEPCATYFMMKPRDKFCKMCGAKMEVME